MNNRPYIPTTDNTFIVKVYNSSDRSITWLGRCFGNIKAVRNSYIHRKNWKGTVYCVYHYPSFQFKELLTYTDNHVRIILDTPEAEKISGSYMEGI